MRQLIEQHGFIRAGTQSLSARRRWQRKILDTLATYHEQHRDEPGPGRGVYAAWPCQWRDEALVTMLIERMRDDGLIHSHHGWCRIIKRDLAMSSRPSGKVEPLFGDEATVGTRSGERGTGTEEQ